MKPNDNIKNIVCNSLGSDGGKEGLFWLPIYELAKYPVYPEFFKTELRELSREVGHFVTKNDKTYCAK